VPGYGVAADEHGAGALAAPRVERNERDVLFQIAIERRAHIGDVPPEMPERGWRLRRRRRSNLVEQHPHVVRRSQRRLTGERAFGCRRKRFCVELNRRFGIDRVEVKVVERRRC
jgi:hypothetical protein